ncbi:hypothetical protein WOLCODRAFT_158946 [Wolfiporia cocos MD-104 SS10]|uniref:Uncharacterized protein n=1 Tax=Wolfiporia cocos (strain MD-104) TaxID=742152 RepID=A0A2H3JCR8_WOLCO|nr:hypothetical protein WOLCODRAFT_158946 [Wolfiporia cocos MD-104 SS10]
MHPTTAFIEEEEDDFGYTTAIDLPEYDWTLRRKPFAGAGGDELPPLDNLNINDNAGGMDDQQPPTQTHITTPPPINPTREPVKPERVRMTFDDDEYPSRPTSPSFRTKVGIYAEALAKLRYWDDECCSDYIHGAVGLQHKVREEERRKAEQLDQLNDDSDSPELTKRMPDKPAPAPQPSPRTHSSYHLLKQGQPAYDGEFNLLNLQEVRHVPPKWQIPQVSDKCRETFTPIPAS